MDKTTPTSPLHRISLMGFQSTQDTLITMEDDARHLLIYGDNGTGKDRILRGISLALTGGADDLLGRGTAGRGGKPVRSTSDLSWLLAHGSDRFEVEVNPTDATSYRYKLSKNRKGGLSRKHTVPKKAEDPNSDKGDPAWWLLPVRTVYEWLTSSPEKAAQHFLPFLESSILTEETRKICERHDYVHGVYDKLMGMESETADSMALPQVAELVEGQRDLSDLAKLLDTLLSLRRSMSQDYEAKEQAHDQLVSSAGVEPTEGMIQAAESGVEWARKTLEWSRILANQQGGTDQAAQEIRTEIDRLAGLIRQAETYFEANPIPPEPTMPQVPLTDTEKTASKVRQLINTLDEQDGILTQVASTGTHQCPVCLSHLQGQSVQEVETRAADWRAQFGAWLDGFLSQYNERLTAARIEMEQSRVQHMQMRQQRVQQQQQYTQWVNDRRALTARLEGMQLGRGQGISLPEGVDPSEIPTVEVACERLAHAEDALTRLRTTQEQARSAREMLDKVHKLRRDLERVESSVDALRKVIEDLFGSGLQHFRTSVAKHLPDDFRIDFVLDDDGRRVFRPALIREDGRKDVVLCGGEYAVVLFALAAAVLDRLPGGRPPFAVLMLPEDRGWGPDGLKTLLMAIRSIPYSCVVSANVRPSGRALKGWHYIALEGPAFPQAAGQETPKTADEDSSETEEEQPTEESPEITETKQQSQQDDDGEDNVVDAIYPNDDQQNVFDAADRMREDQLRASLSALGWSADTIDRMKPSTRARVAARDLSSEDGYITSDGSFEEH